ncbi:MAG: sensor histidine kinase [Kibdelosporangium sp.]
MRADVPVEQPQSVTEAADRWYWLWDLYFALAYAAVVTLVLTVSQEPTVAARWGATAALTVIAVLYLLTGRRDIILDRRGWRSGVFAAVAIGGLGVSMYLAPISGYGMFVVIPLMFMSQRLVVAVVLVVVTLSISSALSVLRDPDQGFTGALIPVVIGTVFSVMIGVWIDRVIAQSSERGQLIKELEASQAEVARLSHEAGVTTERERLAGEIHDTLAQGFTSIVTLVQAAESELGRDESRVREHLELAVRTARENLAESRALVAALAPAELTESSVVDAIRRQGAKTMEQDSVIVLFDVHGDRRPLPTSVEVVLLRTVQESLSNVRKHADAGTAEIVLSYQDSSVVLLVTDDGAGFDPSSQTSGFGLRGMRSRVEQVGGSLTVTSSPGAGTTVELEVRG